MIFQNIDEKTDGVVTINALGVIQMVNKGLLTMFGYKKGMLEGKNVSILMPAPFSQKHSAYMRAYVATGISHVLDTQRDLLALHKDRFVFPIKAAITKARRPCLCSPVQSMLVRCPAICFAIKTAITKARRGQSRCY